jgi:hypothetical protein
MNWTGSGTELLSRQWLRTGWEQKWQLLSRAQWRFENTKRVEVIQNSERITITELAEG